MPTPTPTTEMFTVRYEIVQIPDDLSDESEQMRAWEAEAEKVKARLIEEYGNRIESIEVVAPSRDVRTIHGDTFKGLTGYVRADFKGGE